MSSAHQGWPEPIVRVQSVSETGAPVIPSRYVRAPEERPTATEGNKEEDIPVVDMEDGSAAAAIGEACREWGFFQVVNHGVRAELMDAARDVWRQFFCLPMEAKQAYANSPATYEGYGSRLGVEKGAVLDWSDYYFLHFLPLPFKDRNKWPALPPSCRDTMEEYGTELVQLCGVLMRAVSASLGLAEGRLLAAFGGEAEAGACLRVNFYPRCPQPQLTLGLSPHSDPGGLTLLLPDPHVPGLQVRRGGAWVTVKPAPHAFIVNIADQIQVLSNARYRSVEHRVVVNPGMERLSLAFFYNPRSDLPMEPLPELVPAGTPPLYGPMTFDQYRLFIRLRGPRGKSQVESLQSACEFRS